MPFRLGPLELLIILVVVLLIFGPKNLPKLGNALGKTVKSLREGLGSGKKEMEDASDTTDTVEEVVEEVVEEAPTAKSDEAAKKTVKRVVKKKAE